MYMMESVETIVMLASGHGQKMMQTNATHNKLRAAVNQRTLKISHSFSTVLITSTVVLIAMTAACLGLPEIWHWLLPPKRCADVQMVQKISSPLLEQIKEMFQST